MLTQEVSDQEVAATVIAGGAGYLPYNSPKIELIRIVRYNGNGAIYHTPEVAELVLKTARYNSNGARPGQRVSTNQRSAFLSSENRFTALRRLIPSLLYSLVEKEALPCWIAFSDSQITIALSVLR